jgi:heme exporter protein B
VIRLAWLIGRKDLRIEWRSRVLVWQVAPFSVMALVIAGLAVGPNVAMGRRLAPGLLYLVTTFVALQVIARSHAAESSTGTSTSVVTLGLDGGAVYLGKVIALFTHLVVVVAALVATGSVLFHLHAHEVLTSIPTLTLSLAAIAASGVLYGALTKGSGSLLPVIALPALAPVLIAGERSMTAIIHGGPLARWVTLLAVMTAAYGAVGVLLYGAVEES